MYDIEDSHDMISVYCLFMIFNFKIDLLFIKNLNILKPIAFKNEFINYRNLKGFDSQTLLTTIRVPRLQCQTLLIPQYLTYD